MSLLKGIAIGLGIVALILFITFLVKKQEESKDDPPKKNTNTKLLLYLAIGLAYCSAFGYLFEKDAQALRRRRAAATTAHSSS